MTESITLVFKDGTLLVDAPQNTTVPLSTWCMYDRRVNCWRSDAKSYADVALFLYKNKIPYVDKAKQFCTHDFTLVDNAVPRNYQSEAINAWVKSSRRGVVILPTGTGKTFVAKLAIANAARSALIVVPTIDLMLQWADQLAKAFNLKIGMFGGGSKEICDITVSTYDSALIMLEFYGNRFGTLIVDECHHLPGETYSQIAKMAIAPFRLGLTATPERADGKEFMLDELLGPVCFRRDIDEMGDSVLASYETKVLYVDLDDAEFCEYKRNRELYISFLKRHNIRFDDKMWGNFLMHVAREPEGHEVMKAFSMQKEIATSCKAKFTQVWKLLNEHSGCRIIIFTADNKMAYKIGERFKLPVITHHTKAVERKEFLDCFRSGEYPCLVTSKVLNEGVDVPEAEIGIVVSGSGSIREHVQRLGRILRPRPGKMAILYEIVTVGTAEGNISDRRRQHRAYERNDYL